MATLDLAGIITRVCTDLKEKFASIDSLAQKQDKLVSGTNIKTINSTSLLGSGNVSIVNSVGYLLRTDAIGMTASDSCGSLRIWLTSADGTKMVPINTSTSGSTTAAKTLNTRPIDPFGRIIYYASSGIANSYLSSAYQWDQNTLEIGYSYVKTLTNKLPVYLRCTPQTDGSAVMVDVVQALPSTKDGYIYIFLGTAYSSTRMELQMHHPVYWHDGTGIRLWEGAESGSGGGGSSWTDISSGYAAGLIAANETDMFDQLDIVAYTNGQLVYLSGEISRTSVNTMTLPSGYEATGYAAGGALDLDSGAPATCYITSFTDYNGFDAVDANMEACGHFTFTIIYPIA